MGFGIQGLGFRVQGLGVQGSGFRVQGFRGSQVAGLRHPHYVLRVSRDHGVCGMPGSVLIPTLQQRGLNS